MLNIMTDCQDVAQARYTLCGPGRPLWQMGSGEQQGYANPLASSNGNANDASSDGSACSTDSGLETTCGGDSASAIDSSSVVAQ